MTVASRNSYLGRQFPILGPSPESPKGWCMCNLYSNFATLASMAKALAANRGRSGSAEAGPIPRNKSPAIAGA
jgi:hypothetical protein